MTRARPAITVVVLVLACAAPAHAQRDAAAVSGSDAQLRRGLTLEKGGQREEAAAAFRDAWNLDPGSAVKAYYEARHGSGPDRVQARKALTSAYDHLRETPSGPAQPFPVIDQRSDYVSSTPVASTAAAAAHLAAGHAAETEGRVGDARREYEAALEGTQVGRAAIYVGLGRLAQVDGDPIAAIEAFQHAADLDPNNANVHKELAMALGPQGRIDDALCEAIAALLIDARDAQAHAIIGQLYLDAGQPSNAVTPLARALALRPELYETHYALAAAFRRLGRTADAARELELFERGRTAAQERRRREIAHDVDEQESVRRGAPDRESR